MASQADDHARKLTTAATAWQGMGEGRLGAPHCCSYRKHTLPPSNAFAKSRASQPMPSIDSREFQPGSKYCERTPFLRACPVPKLASKKLC
jgi:hypothetical protein